MIINGTEYKAVMTERTPEEISGRGQFEIGLEGSLCVGISTDHAVDDDGIVGRLRFNRMILVAPSQQQCRHSES
jgi:hypothetical protein